MKRPLISDSMHRVSRLVLAAYLLALPFPTNAGDLGDITEEAGKQRPNIVLILVDALRADHLGI